MCETEYWYYVIDELNLFILGNSNILDIVILGYCQMYMKGIFKHWAPCSSEDRSRFSKEHMNEDVLREHTLRSAWQSMSNLYTHPSVQFLMNSKSLMSSLHPGTVGSGSSFIAIVLEDTIKSKVYENREGIRQPAQVYNYY